MALSLQARIGRKDGIIIDASRGSARVRHAGALDVGTQLTVTFKSFYGMFAGPAEVTSCRVVGTSHDGSTEFESLIRFGNLPAESAAILDQMVADQEEK